MIDKTTYKLPESNYHKSKPTQSKNRIIIGNTFSNNMNHFIGWLHRNNGRFKRTATYTIDLNGNIYEHFPPEHYSDFISIDEVNKFSISIVLENEGWFVKDLINENKYITHNGNIYSRDNEIIIKRWRGFKFWAPYSSKQIDALIELVKILCVEYGIELKAIENNLNTAESFIFEGVMYRSNFDSKYTDVSPAWDSNTFKNKLEKTLDYEPKKKSESDKYNKQ